MHFLKASPAYSGDVRKSESKTFGVSHVQLPSLQQPDAAAMSAQLRGGGAHGCAR